MSFWKLPNEDKTARNVNEFLNEQLQRLALQSGKKLTSLKSPSFDSIGGGGFSNSNENKMVVALNAQQALDAIIYTMECTYGNSPKILYMYYVQKAPVWKIRSKLYIDHDSFPKAKKRALCQFAEVWNATQDKLNWAEEDRQDLRIFD